MTPERWTRLTSALACDGGAREFDLLWSAYSEPHRFYHGVSHIEDCLARFDEARDIADFPHEVELALWFHDAIYIPDYFRDRYEDSARRNLQAAIEALR